MANFELTQGKFTLIDDEDFAYLSRWKWCITAGYASRAEYPIGSKGLAYRVLMHRVILACPDKLQVDHINGDRLDNRRSNLRVVSASQNQWNKGTMKNNTSGHKGISWDRVNKKWRSSINVHSKYVSIGRFETIEEAVEARLSYARQLHGEFARQI